MYRKIMSRFSIGADRCPSCSWMNFCLKTWEDSFILLEADSDEQLASLVLKRGGGIFFFPSSETCNWKMHSPFIILSGGGISPYPNFSSPLVHIQTNVCLHNSILGLHDSLLAISLQLQGWWLILHSPHATTVGFHNWWIGVFEDLH